MHLPDAGILVASALSFVQKQPLLVGFSFLITQTGCSPIHQSDLSIQALLSFQVRMIGEISLSRLVQWNSEFA